VTPPSATGNRIACRNATSTIPRAVTDRAARAVELGLVDELRMFRNPVVIGGGTPFLPPVIEGVPLD